MSPSAITDISVIICAHNPRPDYLCRTLEGLKAQSLPTGQWELLLIDNASGKPLSENWDLKWHSRARHVRELELGLTAARLRGICEAKGSLLIFVDDDNVLSPDYLSAATELFTRRADLGVASGRLLPEYESSPPEWFRPYESWIAIRRLERSVWSNFFDPRAEPCGAGICLRRDIALAYAKKASTDTGQRLLGRKGASLLSGEDVVITKTALDLGYSMGQFIELNALHLIPARRVSEKYLFSLYCHLVASGQLISWLEQSDQKPISLPPWRVWAKAFLRLIKGGRLERRLVFEEFRAFSLARRTAREAAVNMSRIGEAGAFK